MKSHILLEFLRVINLAIQEIALIDTIIYLKDYNGRVFLLGNSITDYLHLKEILTDGHIYNVRFLTKHLERKLKNDT